MTEEFDEQDILVRDERFEREDKFLKIVSADVTFPRFAGGVQRQRFECLERGDSAALLLLDPADDHVVLVEQYRYPAHRRGRPWLVELIAGKIPADGKESPADVAIRECREETGCGVSDLKLVSVFFVSPGGTSERIHLFYGELAGESAQGDVHGLESEGENTRVVKVRRQEFRDHCRAGAIEDAKTLIAGLLMPD